MVFFALVRHSVPLAENAPNNMAVFPASHVIEKLAAAPPNCLINKCRSNLVSFFPITRLTHGSLLLMGG